MDFKQMAEFAKIANNPEKMMEQVVMPRLMSAEKSLLDEIEKLEAEHECGDDAFVAHFFAQDGEEIALFVAVVDSDGNIKKPIKKFNREQVIELILQNI